MGSEAGYAGGRTALQASVAEQLGRFAAYCDSDSQDVQDRHISFAALDFTNVCAIYFSRVSEGFLRHSNRLPARADRPSEPH